VLRVALCAEFDGIDYFPSMLVQGLLSVVGLEICIPGRCFLIFMVENRPNKVERGTVAREPGPNRTAEIVNS